MVSMLSYIFRISYESYMMRRFSFFSNLFIGLIFINEFHILPLDQFHSVQNLSLALVLYNIFLIAIL